MSRKAEIGVSGSLLVLTWALACASTTGKGSETHFTACEEDADCPSAEPYCVALRCAETPTSGAGGAGSGGDSGSGGATSECGPLPPAIYRCAQFCGSDRIMDLECRDGAWICPEETPQRVDLCPEDTCWFPGATCCSNDGTLVQGSCPGGGEMVCPPASAPRPSEGQCPSTCASIPDPPAGPHPVTFQLTNGGGADVAVWQGCVLTHAITACVDGYEAALPTWTFCTQPCGSDLCPTPTCGPCRDEPEAMAEGGVLTLGWSGTLHTTEAGQSCACYVARTAPAGSYRITVPVFPSEPLTRPGGGYYRTSLYEVAVDFTLPAPGGVVEIPLDSSPYLAPCPGPGLCLTRLDPDSAESGCTLEPSAEPDCPSEAPRRFRCERPVPLDEACVEGARETADVAGADGVVRCCP